MRQRSPPFRPSGRLGWSSSSSPVALRGRSRAGPAGAVRGVRGSTASTGQARSSETESRALAAIRDRSPVASDPRKRQKRPIGAGRHAIKALPSRVQTLMPPERQLRLDHLRARRQACSVTQVAAGEALGISERHYRRIENGESELTPELRRRLLDWACKELDAPENALLIRASQL